MRMVIITFMLVACRVGLTVPADVQASCTSNADCPATMSCRTTIGRCVAATALAADPPSLTAVPTLTPSIGSKGTTFALAFTVSTALGADPVVALDGTAPFSLDASATDRAALSYVFDYTATGNETPGNHAIAIAVIGSNGAAATLAGPALALDFSAPGLQPLATSTGPTGFTAVFTKPVDKQSAENLTNYQVTPALDLIVASLASDQQTLTFVSATQIPGSAYQVVAANVSDLVGNAIASDNTTDFTGFGDALASAAPAPLSPANGGRAFDLQTTLIWSAPPSASIYTVDVATDAAFTQPIAASPFTLTATELPISVPSALTYYWRVRADTTAIGQYGSSSFNALDDVAYVYCPSTATCSDAGMIGNIGRPWQTIAGGLADAKQRGLTRVDVAARGSGGTYGELVLLSAGIDLYGGYSPAFDAASRDPAVNVTEIFSSTLYTVLALGIDTPTLVDGFQIDASAPFAGIGLYVTQSSALTVQNNQLTCAATGSLALEGFDNSTFVVDRNTFSGSCQFSMQLNSATSTATFTNNTVSAGSIAVFLGTANISNNTINTSASAGIPTSAGQAHFNLANNTINGRVSVTSLASGLIDGNTILYPSSRGIQTDGGVTVSNNIIAGTGIYPGDRAGIVVLGDLDATSVPLITNNVIIGGAVSSGDITSGINVTEAPGSTPVPQAIIVNNIIATDNTSAGTRYGVYDSTGATGAFGTYSFLSNVVCDAPDGLYAFKAGATYDTSATLNTKNDIAGAGSTDGLVAGNLGNDVIATCADIAFAGGGDYHLTASTPASIRHGGVTASSNVCWTPNGSCGDVTTDKDGAARAAPYSIGAYQIQ